MRVTMKGGNLNGSASATMLGSQKSRPKKSTYQQPSKYTLHSFDDVDILSEIDESDDE